uniref:Ankyrin repeat domain-containing protein n=1 Tax=Corethron hystrix TaxID=216773 RepID=A0A7S1G1V8_9STRA|mmetsp:Transcript_7550/g.16365  ORF Transcript_7550/g.16365 Transcript_7550/m.16365 type:complete len:189 (+) Transcript_7550:208-774(+)|eukprot:CAMPEP_0113316336 /NCGR_PEP_ID=MMETSP0010_2-20120614/11651_1 /TAXON_ID=216773 ORGANISM="Corethron hystrix, Strain 308" /NCGR_SAMPLE_ID=MMETSP0010_2 /ASSEMBLY_ACC=CAM_ASM_000155 /LENGTH=188 /DNA_ID=CAMNT_0000173029 /DNA_START=80 /DNA_END=646 /DNA_ORIENTATION=+ /assembly_acc=CAM_ASM_000155
MLLFKILTVTVLWLSTATHAQIQGTKEDQIDYFDACGRGNYDKVKEILLEHPSFVNIKTEFGETCLHLSSIDGSEPITELLLSKGGDPNARVTAEEGLRMHPLSWHVYGGHLRNVQMLIDHGADVNAPFYHKRDKSHKDTATVLDIVDLAIRQYKEPPQSDNRHVVMRRLLEDNGGKRYMELQDGDAL